MKTIIKTLSMFLAVSFVFSAFVFAQTKNYKRELAREMAQLYENHPVTIAMETMLEKGYITQEEFDGFRDVVDGEIDEISGVVKRNMYVSQSDYDKRIPQIKTELSGKLEKIAKQYDVFQLQNVLYGYLPKQQIKLLNYKLKQKNISRWDINAALCVLESVSYNITNGSLTPKDKRKLLISVYKTADKAFGRHKDKFVGLKGKFRGLTAAGIARKMASIKTDVDIPVITEKFEPIGNFFPLTSAELLRHKWGRLQQSLKNTKARIVLMEKAKEAIADLEQVSPNMNKETIGAIFGNVIFCVGNLYDDKKQAKSKIKNIFNSEFAKAVADWHFKKAEIIYKSGHVNINGFAAYHDFYVFVRDYSSNQIPRPIKTSIKPTTPLTIIAGISNEIKPLEFLRKLDTEGFDKGIKSAKKLAMRLRKNKIVEYLNSVTPSNIVRKGD